MKILAPVITVALLCSCSHRKETSDQKEAREVSEAFRQGKISEEEYINLRIEQTTEARDEARGLD